jgi:hypothetical protein
MIQIQQEDWSSARAFLFAALIILALSHQIVPESTWLMTRLNNKGEIGIDLFRLLPLIEPNKRMT